MLRLYGRNRMKKRYAVIACPKCKTKKIVDTSSKSTICNRCNKKLDLKQVRFLFESNSQAKARVVIGILNAEQDGKEKEFVNYIQQ